MKRIFSIIMVLAIMLSITIPANAMKTNGIEVVSNGYTTYLIDSNGNVKAWGRNTNGEVGNNTTLGQLTPVDLEGLANIEEIVLGTATNSFAYAINNIGQVYAWGDNEYGQLGIVSTLDMPYPSLVQYLPAVSKIVTGYYTTYALTETGDVYAAGYNSYGQLGNGDKINQYKFNKIEQLSNVQDIITSGFVTYALTADKEVYAWGMGKGYQIGTGGFILAQTEPVKVPGLTNVDEVYTNGDVTFAICNDRQDIYSWGEGLFGELGTNSTANYTPKRIQVISDLDLFFATVNSPVGGADKNLDSERDRRKSVCIQEKRE